MGEGCAFPALEGVSGVVTADTELSHLPRSVNLHIITKVHTSSNIVTTTRFACSYKPGIRSTKYCDSELQPRVVTSIFLSLDFFSNQCISINKKSEITIVWETGPILNHGRSGREPSNDRERWAATDWRWIKNWNYVCYDLKISIETVHSLIIL